MRRDDARCGRVPGMIPGQRGGVGQRRSNHARTARSMPIWCQLAAAILMLVGGVVSRPPVVALAASTYAPTVLGDSPGTYWRLGEATGTTAADATSNGNTGTYQSGATLAQAGAMVGDSDTAALLDGTSAYVSSTLSGRTADTLEVW